MLVTSAEDCFGVLTKELIELFKQDEKQTNDQLISNAIALLCRARKNRDACYFACNFVLDSRNPRELMPDLDYVKEIDRKVMNVKNKRGNNGAGKYDMFGFEQLSFFDYLGPESEAETEVSTIGACLHMALSHRDMDMIGYQMDALRKNYRDYLWDALEAYADDIEPCVNNEISGLREADQIVNKNKDKQKKDEIFISKAAILLLQSQDALFETIKSCDIIPLTNMIDWLPVNVRPVEQCSLPAGGIPNWVYDCHTIKGKKMGKTDWDMTITEQAALYPHQKGYFDEASWLYTYEQDYKNNVIDDKLFQTILEYAKTHSANPVAFIPYNS